MSGASTVRRTPTIAASHLSRVSNFLVPQLDVADIWRSTAQEGLPIYLYDQRWTASIVAPLDGTLSIEVSGDGVTWTAILSKTTTTGAATISMQGGYSLFRVVFVCGGTPQTGPANVTLTIELSL